MPSKTHNSRADKFIVPSRTLVPPEHVISLHDESHKREKCPERRGGAVTLSSARQEDVTTPKVRLQSTTHAAPISFCVDGLQLFSSWVIRCQADEPVTILPSYINRRWE